VRWSGCERFGTLVHEHCEKIYKYGKKEKGERRKEKRRKHNPIYLNRNLNH